MITDKQGFLFVAWIIMSIIAYNTYGGAGALVCFIALICYVLFAAFPERGEDTRGCKHEPLETKATAPPHPKIKSVFGENYLFKLRQETAYVSALCDELKDIEMSEEQKTKILQIIQDQFEWHIGMMPLEPEYEIDSPPQNS